MRFSLPILLPPLPGGGCRQRSDCWMSETKVSWVQAITNHQSTARKFNSNLGADPERLPAWPRPALLSHRWPLATNQWQIAQHTEPGCQAPASVGPLSGESPHPKDAALHAIKVHKARTATSQPQRCELRPATTPRARGEPRWTTGHLAIAHG